MSMQKGARTTATEALKDKIVEACSQRSMSYEQVRQEIGQSYRSAWLRVNELVKEGRLQVAGKTETGAVTFAALQQKVIPHIPSPTGSVSPVEIVNRIRHTKGNYKTKIAQLEERFGMTVTGILRTAVIIEQQGTFPEDRHREYEQYLRMYREELSLRIAQINAILQTDNFWTKTGLSQFPNDPAYNAAGILEAWRYCLNPEISEAEKKVE